MVILLWGELVRDHLVETEGQRGGGGGGGGERKESLDRYPEKETGWQMEIKIYIYVRMRKRGRESYNFEY